MRLHCAPGEPSYLASVEEVAKLEKALKSGNYDVAAALAADAGST